MDILLVILGVICLLVGLAGCFLPILPGPPVAYLALWLLHFTGYAEFTVTELVVWGLLVVLAQAMDYVTPMLGTKYSGGSKWGNWGCAVGTVAGMFVFQIFLMIHKKLRKEQNNNNLGKLSRLETESADLKPSGSTTCIGSEQPDS